MKRKRLDSDSPETHLVVFDEGDEVMESLASLAVDLDIDGAALSGIGAFSEATVAYFNAETRSYEEIEIREQVELLALIGNLGRLEGTGEPKAHVHVVLGRPDGTTRGGHLIRAVVRPTLELFVTVPGAPITRVEGEGPLALIDCER